MAWPSITPASVADLARLLLDRSVQDGASLVWRGEPSRYPDMRPRLVREFEELHRQDVPFVDFEARVFDCFWEKVQPLLRPHEVIGLHRSDGKPSIQGLNLFQHFGCPTKLLDWSFSPWVAWWFAARSAIEFPGRIWCFDTGVLHSELSRRWDTFKVPNVAGTNIRDVESAALSGEPQPWVCTQYNVRPFPRMAAQQGLFTIAGTWLISHDRLLSELIPEASRFVIEVPARLKIGSLGLLRTMNVDHDSLHYPALDQVAAEVMNDVRDRMA